MLIHTHKGQEAQRLACPHSWRRDPRRRRTLSRVPFYMRMYIMRVIAVGMRGDLSGGEIRNLARFLRDLPQDSRLR